MGSHKEASITSSSPPPADQGPPPERLKQFGYICWALLLIGFVLPFSIIVISSHRPPDGDFTGFYSLGRILDTHPMRDIYDYGLLQQVCNQVHPRAGMYGPLPYPPQVALVFGLFALLPYSLAYTLWLLISIAFYAAGLKLLIDRFLPLDPARRSLLYCFAFGYCPFLIDDAFSGQLTSVGFFGLSLALSEDAAARPFRAGFALSLCAYKPTLLVLIVPMLLVTRHWKVLSGFFASAAALFLAPIPMGGISIWPVFFKSISSYGKQASGPQAHAIRLLVKYVDLSSFSALLPGGRSTPAVALLVVLGAAAAISLCYFWFRAQRENPRIQSLLWATTITWTLLLNLYVPIYDTILVVISLILTASVLRSIPSPRLHRAFTISWVAILVFSWLTVRMAEITSIQFLTLLIAGLGVLQFVMLSKIAPHAQVASRTSNA